ncbi:MAG TPA: sulfatase [Nitrospirota bacterium]|jgi:arylsulfatase
MKIILVTIDTMRQDRAGCYGYARGATPNLDSLAAGSVRFANALTTCPFTVPAHASMLTGKYPGNIPIFFGQSDSRMDRDRDVMLQEVLAENGYETAAFVSSMVMRKSVGLSRGFGVYDDDMTGSEANRDGQLLRDGASTNRAAIKWLSGNFDKDFFLWVHYFDAHGPYVNPEPFASMHKPEDYGPSPVILDAVKEGLTGGIPFYQLLDLKKDGGRTVVSYERDARRYLAQYDAGVRVADHYLGQLVDELKRLGIYDESMIIATSDHGEAMGEGGIYFFHGLTVTPDQSFVPLVVKYPGGRDAGTVVGECASVADITPTVLGEAGFAEFGGCGVNTDGVRLVPALMADRTVLCENEWQRALVSDGLMAIVGKEVPRDGIAYYMDSKRLCGGTTLVDMKSGQDAPSETPAAKGLMRVARDLKINADAKEVAIRAAKIRSTTLEYQKNRVEQALTRHIEEIEAQRDQLGIELYRANGRAKFMEDNFNEISNSRIWRVTAPLRRVIEMLKGLKK